MSRPLQSSLKALEAAVAKLGDEKASTALKAGTDLIKSVVSNIRVWPSDAF